MSSKLAILSTVALACAAAVQGASIVNGGNSTLVARGCDHHDATRPVCQTSGGSPLVSDCVEAIKHMATHCEQNNAFWPSHCTTVETYKTCKIDVCGQVGTRIALGVNCGGYLQSILNECQHDGRVGGYIKPEICNVEYPSGTGVQHNYQLQFSYQK